MSEEYKELESRIGYIFTDKKVLVEALTHSSYVNEKKDTSKSNERLEFLGDSILSVIVSEYLFENYKDMPEGELTRHRAELVCEESLFEFAKSINLGKYMRFSKGEMKSGGNNRPSTLADAFEALLAAIFLEGGMGEAKNFIYSFLNSINDHEKRVSADYKSKLQELMQKKDRHIEYIITDESGPDHKKEFTVEVHVDGRYKGKGIGQNKKGAEQQAAKDALKNMKL